jgi:uncharacterized membrane protein
LEALLGLYAVIAGLIWISLEVRHIAHPYGIGIDRGGFEDAELWAYSGAWLIYGAMLLAVGVITTSRAGRMVGLVVIGLATAKVFLIDMAGLEGLWRVLSLLGLGLGLIGLGAVYRRFVVGGGTCYRRAR